MKGFSLPRKSAPEIGMLLCHQMLHLAGYLATAEVRDVLVGQADGGDDMCSQKGQLTLDRDGQTSESRISKSRERCSRVRALV